MNTYVFSKSGEYSEFNRIHRCTTCWGRGTLLARPNPDEPNMVVDSGKPCPCRTATIDLGTRRHGMVGTAATRSGKHGRRAHTQLGTMSRPRKHWRGDTFIPVEGQMMSDYAVRVALWEIQRAPTAA